jgi:hypothetical protein
LEFICHLFFVIWRFHISAILKFADKEQEKKFRRKMFFSGISEAAQANFNWALIFWFLFYQEKRNPPEAFLAAAQRLRRAKSGRKDNFIMSFPRKRESI